MKKLRQKVEMERRLELKVEMKRREQGRREDEVSLRR